MNFATIDFAVLTVTVQLLPEAQPVKVAPLSVSQPAKRETVPELLGVAVSVTSVSASKTLLLLEPQGAVQAKSSTADPPELAEMAPPARTDY